MNVSERIGINGLVPVVVIEDAEDAVPAAQALLNAGIDIMEITMRTDAGIQSIENIRKAYPDMLVGAGTILSVDKAKEAVAAGADFIVSPGFNPDIVQWCIYQDILITPGCVTPTEIDQALSYGLKILKFFPADVYGGVKACKALNGPYGHMGVKFIPTGGINNNNLAEYADKDYIHAVGGGWLCSREDIAGGRFSSITETALKAVDILLGFEFAHLGINGDNEKDSMHILKRFEDAFRLTPNYGNSSNFAGREIEITKKAGYGKHGHIAIRTNSIQRAVYHLKKRGFEVMEDTAKYIGDKIISIFLKEEIGDFAVHLLQKF